MLSSQHHGQSSIFMTPERWTDRERHLYREWRSMTDPSGPGYTNVHRLRKAIGEVPFLQVRTLCSRAVLHKAAATASCPVSSLC